MGSLADLRGRLERSGARRGVWALADQGAVSLGSFLTAIVVARSFSSADYGVYALTLGVILLFVTFNGSLVTSRLSIEGAAVEAYRLARLTGASVFLAAVVALAGAITLVYATRVLDRPHIAPWAAAALGCWLVQETVRRALMAHLHYRKALFGDVLSYLGQIGIVWTLAQGGQLTLESVFGAIAVTSLLASMVQAAQVGIEWPSIGEVQAMAVRSWRFGCWLLLGNLAGMVTIQGLPWILALARGAAGAGALQAAVNVLGVTHPIMFAVGNLIIPSAAHSRRQGGITFALHTALKYASFGAALLAPCYAVILLWPSEVLSIFYGPSSPYSDLVNVLRLYVLVYCFTYVATILNGVLTSLERSRFVFYAQFASAAGAVIIGLPLIAVSGLTGAVFGSLAASVAYAVAGVVLLRRTQLQHA
jgi:O-antigen/teichoic acid export membrane protein